MYHLSCSSIKKDYFYHLKMQGFGSRSSSQGSRCVSVYSWFQTVVQQRGTAHFRPLSAPVESWDLLQSQVAQKLNHLERSSTRILAQHVPQLCSGTEQRLPQSEGAFSPCRDGAEGSRLCLRGGLATVSPWRLKAVACCQEEKVGKSWDLWGQ